MEHTGLGGYVRQSTAVCSELRLRHFFTHAHGEVLYPAPRAVGSYLSGLADRIPKALADGFTPPELEGRVEGELEYTPPSNQDPGRVIKGHGRGREGALEVARDPGEPSRRPEVEQATAAPEAQ